MKDTKISDPDLYKRLCEPFPSVESANDSLDNFFKDFRELREKYGIPDVLLIVRSIYMDQGELRDALLTMNCGDSRLIFPMLSTIYERQKDKLVTLGTIWKMLDEPYFFSAFLSHIGIAETEEEIKNIIKNGEIKVNGKTMFTDGPAPEEDFTLTVRDESINLPGRNNLTKSTNI